MAVLMACCTSAFSGVYFERILKKKAGSLWLRNIQLGIFGISLGLGACYANDGTALQEGGFLQHYTPDVWLVVLLQALSGLVIASVIKYADNVLKTFANAVSVLFSAAISFLFLGDFTPTLPFCLGAPVVMAATFMYGRPEQIKSKVEGVSEEALHLKEERVVALEQEVEKLSVLLRQRDDENAQLRQRLGEDV